MVHFSDDTARFSRLQDLGRRHEELVARREGVSARIEAAEEKAESAAAAHAECSKAVERQQQVLLDALNEVPDQALA